MINVQQSFLSKEICSDIVNYAIDTDDWNKASKFEFWSGRTIPLSKLGKPLADMILDEVREYIKKCYGIDYVYCDTIDLIKWTPGLSQPVHMDACEDLEHRDYGSIIYLNDNFDGGNTFYANKELTIKPKTGAIAVHPGSKEYEHGVTTVENGTRYTIASFWTKEMGKASYDCLH